jgi:hypothetical protein
MIDFDISAAAVDEAAVALNARYGGDWRSYYEWVDDTVAFHAGGGLNIFLTDHAAINVDLRYVMGIAETHYRAYNTTSGYWLHDNDWVDIHHLQVGVGLCVEF